MAYNNSLPHANTPTIVRRDPLGRDIEQEETSHEHPHRITRTRLDILGGQRDFEVMARLAGDGRGMRGIHTAGVGKDEEKRRCILERNGQRRYVPAREQQTAVHRLRTRRVVVENDDPGFFRHATSLLAPSLPP